MRIPDEINLNDDVLDSRDIIARLEYLRERDGDEDDPLDADEREEMLSLQLLEDAFSGYGDWHHGETLISETYWSEYCEQFVKDCDMLPRDLSPLIANNIDWEGIAKDMRQDYMEEHGFLIRA